MRTAREGSRSRGVAMSSRSCGGYASRIPSADRRTSGLESLADVRERECGVSGMCSESCQRRGADDGGFCRVAGDAPEQMVATGNIAVIGGESAGEALEALRCGSIVGRNLCSGPCRRFVAVTTAARDSARLRSPSDRVAGCECCDRDADRSACKSSPACGRRRRLSRARAKGAECAQAYRTLSPGDTARTRRCPEHEAAECAARDNRRRSHRRGSFCSGGKRHTYTPHPVAARRDSTDRRR